MGGRKVKGFGDWLHEMWHLTHPGQSCEGGGEDFISDVALQRQMLYDAFNDPEDVAAVTGLPAVSGEVADMETRAHHARMEEIKPVLPLLISQADFMGHCAALMQMSNTGLDPGEHVEEHAAIQMVFTNIIRASVIAAVSTAIGVGVLDVVKEVSVE